MTNSINPNKRTRFVELVPPDPNWSESYLAEAALIQDILCDNLITIHHIGSTAIKNIYAKPVIDILPVVHNLKLVDALNAKFEALGYTCMGEYGIPGRRYYWKANTKRHTHHVHIFAEGAPEIERHVAFRNFLNANPSFAQGYSRIKQELAKVFFTDIENYISGKSSFIQLIDYKTNNEKAEQLHAKDDISIEAYHPAWPKLAEAEINTIKKFINLSYVQIEHIGSTAVPDLMSKPIIDIFIVLENITAAEQWIKPLEYCGYIFWSENPDKTHLRFFKGMPPFGMKRTHHIHIISVENNTIEHRVLFRDILRSNEKIRMAYQDLKLALARQYQSDRELYTDKKLQFITDTLRQHGYTRLINK